jgi:hypothetical protein
MPGATVIFLRSEAWDARWLAVSTALTAAAHGGRVRLALFEAPLRAWVEGRFDEGAPPPAARAGAGGLEAMVREAAQALDLRVVACDTAVRLSGVDPAAAAACLAVTTLPALWAEAGPGRLLSF